MTKREIHQLCFTRVGLLIQQVLVAQVAGICMILFPSLLLGGVFRSHAWAAAVVAAATVLYLFAVRIPLRSKPDSVTLLDRLRRFLGALVFLDVLIMLGLIGLSGGLARSHLTFVLALIPPILALVRGGGLTVIGICVLTTVAIGFDILASLMNVPSISPTGNCASWMTTIFGFQSGDPQAVSLFPIATSVGVLSGIALSLVQSYLASGETLPEDALMRVVTRHQNDLDDDLDQFRLRSILARSYHKVSRIVSLTNHPDIHSSLVHPIDDLIFEAYILCVPAYKIRGPRGASLMANTVFAVHWLDDLVDGLGYHSFLDGSGGKPTLDLGTMTLPDVARRFRPHGAERILDLITGRMSPLQRLSLSKPSWPVGVESGLMRVVLGGVIQSSTNKLRRQEAIKRCRKDAQHIVEDSELDDILSQVSPVFLWSISKTDMPLVLGMYANPKDTPQLGSLSLILDALFMPLLVWHNLEEEVKRESVGKRPFHIHSSFTEDIGAAVENANLILTAKGEMLRKSNLWVPMQYTLKHVFSEFADRLPTDQPYHEYRQIVKSLNAQ